MTLRAKTSLRATQTQRLGLTPGVRTALGMLGMGMAELGDMLVREAAENPFLLISRPASGGQGGTVTGQGDMRTSAPGSRGAFDVAMDGLASRPSLLVLLHAQIGTMRLPEHVRNFAWCLLAELDDTGMLDASLTDLAAASDMAPDDAAQALAAVQACEPSGVGARSLAECLALQLRDKGYDAALADAAVARLDLFARRRWREIESALGLPGDRITALARDIRGLRMRPVEPLDDHPRAAPLAADLVLERLSDGRLRVAASRAVRIEARLDPALAATVTGTSDAALRDALSRAEAIISALAFRKAALQRIGDEILRQQTAFFDQGPKALLPMTRAKIAQNLGVHASTVTRAVAGKAIEADGVLIPLARLFGARLTGAGGVTSAGAVQNAIRLLVAGEPPGRPLSDDRLCALLHADGVDIARRTVAKYRERMRIPPSSERRRRAASRDKGRSPSDS